MLVDLELLVVIVRRPDGVPVVEIPADLLDRHTRSPVLPPVVVRDGRARLTNFGFGLVATARGAT